MNYLADFLWPLFNTLFLAYLAWSNRNLDRFERFIALEQKVNDLMNNHIPHIEERLVRIETNLQEIWKALSK